MERKRNSDEGENGLEEEKEMMNCGMEQEQNNKRKANGTRQ